MIGSFFNATWLYTWTRNTPFWISFSSILLLSLLACNLLTLFLAKSFKPDNGHSFLEFIFVDVAFSVYAGWTTVASIVNVSITLMVNKWDGFGISSSNWAAVMILIAAAINILYLFRERNTIYPLVFSWASLAIMDKNGFDSVVGQVCGLCSLGVLATTMIYEGVNNTWIKKGKQSRLSRNVSIYRYEWLKLTIFYIN